MLPLLQEIKKNNQEANELKQIVAEFGKHK